MTFVACEKGETYLSNMCSKKSYIDLIFVPCVIVGRVAQSV
jgi:hypothetical protein